MRKVLAVCLIFALLPLVSCGRDGAEHEPPSDDSESSDEWFGYSVDARLYQSAEEHSLGAAASEPTSRGREVGRLFVTGDFSVTLPYGFIERYTDDFELYAVDAEEFTGVSVLVTSFSDLYAQGLDAEMSAAEYARKAALAEGIDAAVRDRTRCAYLEYTADTESGRYRYFVYVYRGETAFYTLQFFCNDADADSFRLCFDGIAETVVLKSRRQKGRS